MTNPLTSLDELIWKQFEKVTQYAHKNYGWDKYDCAQVTSTAAGGSMVGYGVYSVLAAVATDSFPYSIVFVSVGVACGIMGTIFPSYAKKIHEEERRKELKKLLNKGAVEIPRYTARRPVGLLIALDLAAHGIPGKSASNNEGVALHLAVLTGAFYISSLIGTSYFRDQIPMPPSTKKLFWKTMYQKIADKFKLKPALQPSKEPAAKYESIDELVS